MDSAGIYKEKSFNFLLTFDSENFDETEEGLLGLNRSNDREYDMIIDRLHKSGKISSKVFSVYMDYGSSSIQIGDYDLTLVREPTVPI